MPRRTPVGGLAKRRVLDNALLHTGSMDQHRAGARATLQDPEVTLVLLPGLDGTEIFFGPLLAQLPSWIEPVVVTYPPAGPNAYDDLVPVVFATVGKLTDFAVLGWSFGGPLA